METKTCEQYVVAKLVETENLYEAAKERCKELEGQAEFYEKALARVKELLTVSYSGNSDPQFRISMDTIWEKYDTEIFYDLVKLFGLEAEIGMDKKENTDG